MAKPTNDPANAGEQAQPAAVVDPIEALANERLRASGGALTLADARLVAAAQIAADEEVKKSSKKPAKA